MKGFNETKGSFFLKINKIEKSLGKLTKRERRSKLIKLKVKGGYIIINII
jgi:hypothetical protein